MSLWHRHSDYWAVLAYDPNDDRRKPFPIAVLGALLNRAKATRIAEDLATALNTHAMLTLYKGGTGPLWTKRNPTLAAHGAGPARWHVITASDSAPVADLYRLEPNAATKVAQGIADIIGVPLLLLSNRALPKHLSEHSIMRTISGSLEHRPRGNPATTPGFGQVWASARDGSVRVLVVKDRRVQVSNLRDGTREWIDLADFRASFKPTRSATKNPSRSKRARASRAKHRAALDPLNRKTRRASLKALRRPARPGNAAQPLYYLESARARRARRPYPHGTPGRYTEGRGWHRNPKGDALPIFGGKYLLEDQGEQRYPNLGTVRTFTATGKRGAVYGAMVYEDGRFVWMNVGNRGGRGSVPFDLAQVSPLRFMGPRSNPGPWRISGTVSEMPARKRRTTAAPALAVVRAPRAPRAPRGPRAPRDFTQGEAVTVPYTGRASYFGRAVTHTRERGEFQGYTEGAGGERMAIVLVRRGRSVESHTFPVKAVRRRPRRDYRPSSMRSPKLRTQIEHAIGGDADKALTMLELANAQADTTEARAKLLQPDYKQPSTLEYRRARRDMNAARQRRDIIAAVHSHLVGYQEGQPDPWAIANRRRRSTPKRHNPRNEMARARNTFRKWHEFDASRTTRVHGPNRVIPKTLVKLGELVSVTYRSDKFAGGPDNPDGRVLTYEHKTKSPRPVLATDPDGQDVHIVGGRMRVTPDGLVN